MANVGTVSVSVKVAVGGLPVIMDMQRVAAEMCRLIPDFYPERAELMERYKQLSKELGNYMVVGGRPLGKQGATGE